MFGLFAKKEIELYAPVKGECIELSKVNDQVFAQKMMGDGLAFNMEVGEIFAPCDCEVQMLFPTLHAIGLKTKNNVEILIHIGMDTVNLNGEGFKAYVKQGDKLKKGQKMIEVDMNLLKEKNIDLCTPMIITSKDTTIVDMKYGKVSTEDVVVKVK